ncbi:hypothetical protein CDAR_491661 [Caerostris darwini]|uniref:Uncharacterized protein n=1 Tax=Caerostris darwini TaxID=1538125 RepID=A0AAV4N1J1_9ARAC|nr:hypothetical protein CDAR_491661 [Caerostris darwini]
MMYLKWTATCLTEQESSAKTEASAETELEQRSIDVAVPCVVSMKHLLTRKVLPQSLSRCVSCSGMNSLVKSISQTLSSELMCFYRHFATRAYLRFWDIWTFGFFLSNENKSSYDDCD